MIELRESGLSAQSQVGINAIYKGIDLGIGFKADLIIENQLLIELKTVKSIEDVHLAQAITYLKLLNFKRGYILNFNQKLLKDGIKRISI